MNELFVEDEPDKTQHIYLTRGKETFDLTYLHLQKLSKVAGTPRENVREAALAHDCTVRLIVQLLDLGARVRW